MPKILNDIANMMDNMIPNNLAEGWDNVGLLIGNPSNTIKKIMVCLEVTPEIINEAIGRKADLIICHHPLIFKAMKSIKTDEPIGNMVYKLIQNEIAVYCAHTNLDIIARGTNDVLADLLDIKEKRPLISSMKNEEFGLGRIGVLSRTTTLLEIVKSIKFKLGLRSVKVVGNDKKEINKIALCTGSGAEFISNAYKAGCDLYITGDVKYHDAQYAKQLGIAVIDAGHFETEDIVCKTLAKDIKNEMIEKGYDIEVFVSDININPFDVY
ncbi:Nif3-like dinuclear metal center hexameric protein [Lutibacter sp. B2]|nr:Nif3-like dinuclear metal center hexameric protein [Lutibacter sp. B2]